MAAISYGQFEIKGLGGINFASLSKQPSGTDWKATAGYQFGLGVLIGDKFYVEPGVQFVPIQGRLPQKPLMNSTSPRIS